MKRITLLVCFFLILTQVNFGQNSNPDWIATALQEQSSRDYRETIHLQINSTFLLVGETLLFKASCLNYYTNVVSELSSVARIELIDENANSVLQVKIRLMDGNGQGDLYLPSTLLSGNYTLIAYTNWMKNFLPSAFFQKQITIINPFKKPVNSSPLKKLKPSIELFAEGGVLLAGVTNTVGYLVNSEKAKSVKTPIKILDEKSNVVLEFSINKSGIGRFEIKPTAKSVYKALIIDSLGQVFFENLPETQLTGIGIHVTENPSCFNIGLTSTAKEGLVRIRVQHKGLSFLEVDTVFSNSFLDIKIKKEQLPFGFSQILIDDSEKKNVCQREIYNPTKTKALVDFNIEKSQYKTRNKVIIALKLKDSLSAGVSVSVRKLEKNHHHNNQPISNYFSGNEIIIGNSLDSLIVFDDLMLLRRTKYEASDIKSNKNIKYLPEVRGNLFTGKVTKNDSVLTKATNVYLSVPSKQFLFFISKTDTAGRFFFNTDQIYSDNSSEVVLQVNPETCPNCKISLEPEGLDSYTTFKPEVLEINPSSRSIIEKRSIWSQIENAYYIQKKDSINKKQITSRFYGKPDKVYRLDDYVRFSTMEDIFIEYILEVIAIKEKKGFKVRVMNLRKYERFVESPLILIDGIPVFDQQQLMKYDPRSIDRIEVIGRRYFYGPLEFQGIISVYTNDGDGKSVAVPRSDKIIPLEAKRKYYAPNDINQSKNLDRVPDYRTQLFWNPNVLLNGIEQSLEFFTSDIEGAYEIVLEGVTKRGTPIYHSEILEVNK